MIENLQAEINRAFASEQKLDWELNSKKTIDLTFEVISLNHCRYLSYEDAKLYCFSLTVDGKTGWRFPTEEECEQLKRLWIFCNRIWLDQPDTVYDFTRSMPINCYQEINNVHLVIPVRGL